MHTPAAAMPEPAPDAPYHQLATLPRTLWLPALISHTGAAAQADHSAQRLADVQRWRSALAQGQLPPADADFGDPQACAALRSVVGALNLPATTRSADAMAEQVLRTLLWHLDRLIDLQPALGRDDAIAQTTQEFSATWQLLQGDWAAAQALLQGLGEHGEMRWDVQAGQLQRREWQTAQQLSETLKTLPALVALIRRLGRAQRAAQPLALPPHPAPAPPPHHAGQRAVETRLPGMPGELLGIRQSDRIDAMLGSEAVMLLHPVLKKLWRARRAEGRLLTYDSQAVWQDWLPDPGAPPRQTSKPPHTQALERGPIIVCIDTSGSMRGAPETLAKAVVLQAVRTAHAERRGCLLIAFGGPGEIIERELVHSRDGLAALLDVLGQAFDGGTDLQGPIEHAIHKVQRARWASADLLIVSDGEFGCTAATLARLDAARAQQGLRVQGVLVGDRETMGLMEVADDIFWVRDWRRFSAQVGPQAGAQARASAAFSPVHSKSLTALYFPNALSDRAARHKPG